jgi:hypothetical protein
MTGTWRNTPLFMRARMGFSHFTSVTVHEIAYG